MAAASRVKARIVCISDTHNAAPGEGYTLPAGDVLIHAGDLTNQGSLPELTKALAWIEKADFAVKVVVAGNHDLSLDSTYSLKHAQGWTITPTAADVAACRALITAAPPNITYLQHAATVIPIRGKDVSVKIFGSPFSPDRGKQNWAFQYGEHEAEALWTGLPDDADVVVTHTPPAGYCDSSAHWVEGGCPGLARRLGAVKPLLAVCGHCHEGRGARIVDWDEGGDGVGAVRCWEDPEGGSKKLSLLDLTGRRGGELLRAGRETAVVNASVMARSFGRGAKRFNKPVVVDLLLPARETCEALQVSASEAEVG